MRIIDRSLKHVRDLSVVEMEGLRLFVTGKAGAPALLSRVRQDGHWLSCECQQPGPVMHVARRDDGSVSLKNNPDGREHAPGCQFDRSTAESGTKRTTPGHELARVPIGSHAALHSEFHGTGKGIGGQISRSATLDSRHRNSLLSMLMTLIELAELGVYSPARPLTLGEQFAAIRHAAARFTIHPGIPMDHVFDTRISKARLVAMAKRLRDVDGFGKSRRYGLLADVIKSTGPRNLVIDDDVQIDFFGNVESLHGKKAPLLTLATVTTQEINSNFYQLGKVAFVPVLSPHHLFPVVNESDRDVVSEVFGLLRWLDTKKQIQTVATRDVYQEGAGYVMTIRTGGLLFELDLNPSSLDGPSPSASVLSLSELGSLEALKKRIAVTVIKGASGE